jgi:hypothetical protein
MLPFAVPYGNLHPPIQLTVSILLPDLCDTLPVKPERVSGHYGQVPPGDGRKV